MTGVKENANYFQGKVKGANKVNQYDAIWAQYIIQNDKTFDLAEQIVYFIENKENIFQIVCTAKSTKIKEIKLKLMKY